MSHYVAIQPEPRIRHVILILAWTTVCVGSLVIVGWLANIPTFKNIIPGLPTMKFNTALLFILTGVSLIVLDNHRLIAQTLAIIVFLIAVLTLGEYAFGWQLGIDETVIQDITTIPTTADGTKFPGRMSIATAINFSLIGVSLMLIVHSQKLSQLFIVLVIALSFMPAIGYLYNTRSLQQVIPFATLAIHTSMTFIIVGIGILLRQTTTPFIQMLVSHRTSGIVLRRLLPVVILLPIIIGWLRLFGENIGLFDKELGTALTINLNIAILLVTIVWLVRYLDQKDMLREKAEQSLQAAYDVLEVRVAERTAELAQLNENLQRSEARFSGVVNTAHDAVISLDEQQIIISFNKGAERIFQYKAEDVIGQHLNMLLPEKFHSIHIQHVTAFGDTDGYAQVMTSDRTEVWGLRKGGDEFPADVSISSLWLDDQCIYTAVIRDATKRREDEIRLLRYADALARTNHELESFVYTASHDLQEPLRKIKVFSDRLQKKYANELEGRALEYLQHLNDASDRMYKLIQDLLAYSQVTTQAKQFKIIDLNLVIQSVLSDLEVAIEQANATIIVKPLISIEADEVQMHQLFQNLIGNAVKYRSPDRQAKIVITGYHIDKLYENNFLENNINTSQYEIVIQDNGIGFDNKYADRIMGVFQRLHGRSQYQGTGIGLAICQKVVEQHHGKIIADGAVGKGATFKIQLPIEQLSDKQSVS